MSPLPSRTAGLVRALTAVFIISATLLCALSFTAPQVSPAMTPMEKTSPVIAAGDDVSTDVPAVACDGMCAMGAAVHCQLVAALGFGAALGLLAVMAQAGLLSPRRKNHASGGWRSALHRPPWAVFTGLDLCVIRV